MIMTTYHDNTEFPFEELRDDEGDFFQKVSLAMERWDVDEAHVWSILETNDPEVWVYAPPHHFINVIGYIVTKETHDHDTYYEERF